MDSTLLGLLTVAVVGLSLGLVVVAYVFKQAAVMFAAGISFIAFSWLMRGQSTANAFADYDIYMVLSWLGFAMVIFCFVQGVLLVRKVPDEPDERSSLERRLDNLSAKTSRINKIRRLTRGE